MKFQWRYGIIAGFILAIFSFYPQLKMLYMRGAEWNGHYAYNDIDEVAYASYLQALIDGRPRRNDPYTGRDDTSETPQKESLFSIQFVAPYTIAIPARILGVNSPWAITVAGAVAAFLTALILFWLLALLTEDPLLAMAGSLCILAGGAIFAGEGAIGEITGWSYAYPYFPGFRRYIPAMAFPAFFLLISVIWKAFDDSNEFKKTFSPAVTAVAIIAFAYTVFSYFYVWTAAAAWLASFTLLVIAFRPEGFKAHLKSLGFIAAGAGVALLPYAYLLSDRSHTMDDVQLLVRTHAPDLTRPPEYICFAVIVFLAAGVLARWFSLKDKDVIFALSLAATPIAVFNQQVITGLSLQPIHYQVFIGNYVAGLAFIFSAGVFLRRLRPGTVPRWATASIAICAVAWGFVECHYTVKILDDVNVIRDESFPIGRRLKELAQSSATPHQDVVLHFGTAEVDDLPSIAPQAVLWARHQHVFAGLTWEENKQRYYQQLYYEGVTAKQLADGMKSNRDFVSIIALFGWGRHTDRLNPNFTPLTSLEIDAEVAQFSAFMNSFHPASPNSVRLNYLVVSNSYEPYLENVDKWYIRDEGELIGKYTLYKLQSRQ
jgi:hypothetical protein